MRMRDEILGESWQDQKSHVKSEIRYNAFHVQWGL